MLMKSPLLPPALLVLVIVVAACAPPPELRNNKYLHDKSIITGDPCEAPCWRGIIPGETSWSDAIKIIEEDTRLTGLQTQDSTAAENPNAKAGDWQEVDGDPSCCQLFSEDGQTVDQIGLQLAPQSTVGELIEAHGNPAYLTGNAVSSDQAVMYLIYLDPPMMVLAFVAGAETGALVETSEIIAVLYTTSDRMQQIVETTSLYGWEGYRSFQAYLSGTPVVTAIPTAVPTQGG